MLVMTAKLSKKKIVAWSLGIVALICIAVFWSTAAESKVVMSDGNVEVQVGNMKSAENRVALLEKFGWQVKTEPVEFMEVTVPKEFDEVYNKYNEIQKAQGMDLTKYQGKRAMRYCYEIQNYPTGEKGILANILVYKGKLIAGDVCSPKLDGFMHGLQMPNKKK